MEPLVHLVPARWSPGEARQLLPRQQDEVPPARWSPRTPVDHAEAKKPGSSRSAAQSREHRESSPPPAPGPARSCPARAPRGARARASRPRPAPPGARPPPPRCRETREATAPSTRRRGVHPLMETALRHGRLRVLRRPFFCCFLLPTTSRCPAGRRRSPREVERRQVVERRRPIAPASACVVTASITARFSSTIFCRHAWESSSLANSPPSRAAAVGVASPFFDDSVTAYASLRGPVDRARSTGR